jgi:alanine transaminase
VPGSGFGQADGTFHFRTTFLPSESDIQGVVQSLSRFHASFLDKFRGAVPLATNGHHAA